MKIRRAAIKEYSRAAIKEYSRAATRMTKEIKKSCQRT
jgi:hypothetical protein